ncbi:antibiotic biosynthesis monooxygenase family protein [Leekyejoonella antrihumi]|uniref:Antibiotic biosynthesis monooxygenase n=1 Tax=Leekyejoonella antrihumi TaxID=1660198 RepID=A0A563E626_9MICO|nr:antibiotic biosynthesis monooxygenase [Leekyejoonella antrihumi]TWP37703.1 antibiotic biosynthesis monooxygenase [Leekyejoonella antrihumi]
MRTQHVSVIEQVILPVRPGEEAEFERAFGHAQAIIRRQHGFRSLRLARCLERSSDYLLVVEWEHLEDHTVGFRESADYQQWRALLHPFYEPVPTVLHFSDVITIAPADG